MTTRRGEEIELVRALGGISRRLCIGHQDRCSQLDGSSRITCTVGAHRAERSGVYMAVEAVFGYLAHGYYTVRELLRRHYSPHLEINVALSHYRVAPTVPSLA